MSASVDLPAMAAYAERAVSALFGRGQAEVRSGRHFGARHPIGSERVSLGSALENDVVLVGSDLAGTHAHLALSGLLGNRLLVEAADGPVEIPGWGAVPAGHTADVPLPATIALADTEIHVTGAPLTRLLPSPRLAGGLLGVVAAFSLALSAASFTSAFVSRETAPPYRSAPVAAVAGEPVAAEARLQALVGESGLVDRVSVSAGGDGGLALRGAIRGPAPLAAWRGLLKSIDATPGLPPVVLDVAVSEDAPTPPTIASVWYDGKPHVLLKGGRRLGLGETTPDGWRLMAVEAGSVVFRSAEGDEVRAAFVPS